MKMKFGPISFEGETLNGSPVFADTNVPIQILFEYLEDGKSIEKFLDEFPAVNKKDVVDVLQIARLATTSEKVLRENFSEK